MFKKISIVIFAALTASTLHARINLFEPWMPGIDTGMNNLYSYSGAASIRIGENLLEIPGQFFYIPDQNLEVGGRWGLISSEGNFGISDLMIGAKYKFMYETDEKPAIIGEAAFSLPTANYSDGLGTGSVALLLNWAVEKEIKRVLVHLCLGANLYSENADGYQPGNVFSYRLGGNYKYDDLLTLHGALLGFNHGYAKTDGTRSANTYQELYFAPGVEYLLNKKFPLYASLLIGLSSESHDVGIILGIKF